MAEDRLLPIAVVARETGLSADILRKWEDRYGFPQPTRSAGGARLYPESQVGRLREIKRLIDAGQRPSSVVMPDRRRTGEVSTIQPSSSAAKARPADTVVAETLVALRAHDLSLVRRLLERELLSRGLECFLRLTVAPLLKEVGDAWQAGSLRVFEEHAFSDVLENVLDVASRTLMIHDGRPRILLTTVPGELHMLGLSMARTLFLETGARCVCLGAQTPLSDIAAAVDNYRIEVLCLSFSEAFPKRQIRPCILELRERIPADVDIWLGGAGTAHLVKAPVGVRLFDRLGDALAELRAMQARRR